MRVTKILVSAVAVGVAVIGLTATSESRAGDEEFVSVSCSGGNLTATGAKGWHTNAAAPWKWDKGEKVSLSEQAATFKGTACTGTVTAFVCNGAQCKGPIKIPVH